MLVHFRVLAPRAYAAPTECHAPAPDAKAMVTGYSLT